MKKVLLFAAFAVFAITTSQAQEFRLGAKLGLNLASLGGDSFAGTSFGSRTSFHIGGLAEIPLMGKLALQPELLYSSEGSDLSIGGIGLYGGNDYKIKLDYIRVPVLAKYYFLDGLSAEAGPVFGVLVSAEQADKDIKDRYNTFDTAIGIGASYRLNMGVFFSIRYNKGLMNVNDDYIDSSGITISSKNQSNVFQVSAGYSF